MGKQRLPPSQPFSKSPPKTVHPTKKKIWGGGFQPPPNFLAFIHWIQIHSTLIFRPKLFAKEKEIEEKSSFNDKEKMGGKTDCIIMKNLESGNLIRQLKSRACPREHARSVEPALPGLEEACTLDTADADHDCCQNGNR